MDGSSGSNVKSQAAASKLLPWVQTFTRLWLHTCRFLSTIATDIVSCVESKTFRCTLLQGTRFSRQVLFQLLPPELIVEPGQTTPRCWRQRRGKAKEAVTLRRSWGGWDSAWMMRTRLGWPTSKLLSWESLVLGPAQMEGQPLHQGSTHHRRSSACRAMQPKQGDAIRPASSVMLVTGRKSVLNQSCAKREPLK